MLVMAVPAVTVWALVPDAELRVIVLFELTVTVLVAVALAQPPVPVTV
jgi:hypothetical protein